MTAKRDSSSPSFAIRLLDPSTDLEPCARMMAESEPWITLGRGYEASRRDLADPTREMYVAAEGPTPLGFVVLNMAGAFVGYIQTVCVAPAHRGLGVGTRLISFAEQRIFRESPNVFLCVSSFNGDARRLYERLGYRLVGELEDYIIPGCSELLMRKSIGARRDFSPGSR
jgi:ribosomal-protein-alanine N-acetyltransferase